MQKRTRSILEELSSIGHQKDKDRLIESRANNVIVSAINLLNHIRESYDADTAAELERRLLNSIRAQDPSKFSRKVRGLQESNKRDPE